MPAPPRPCQQVGLLTPLGALRGPRGIRHDRVFWRLCVIYALLHALDITSTYLALRTGSGAEQAPLYAVLFARAPFALGTLVYALAAGAILPALLPVYVWWPAGARFCLALLCGLLVGICVANLGTLLGMRLW